MFVNVIVTKLTSDNACKVWKKRVFVVPLQSQTQLKPPAPVGREI